MVAITPIPIRTLSNSEDLMESFCDNSETLIVSGILTSLITGATGFSNTCRDSMFNEDLDF
jgi:hypothetical protein